MNRCLMTPLKGSHAGGAPLPGQPATSTTRAGRVGTTAVSPPSAYQDLPDVPSRGSSLPVQTQALQFLLEVGYEGHGALASIGEETADGAEESTAVVCVYMVVLWLQQIGARLSAE